MRMHVFWESEFRKFMRWDDELRYNVIAIIKYRFLWFLTSVWKQSLSIHSAYWRRKPGDPAKLLLCVKNMFTHFAFKNRFCIINSVHCLKSYMLAWEVACGSHWWLKERLFYWYVDLLYFYNGCQSLSQSATSSPILFGSSVHWADSYFSIPLRAPIVPQGLIL